MRLTKNRIVRLSLYMILCLNSQTFAQGGQAATTRYKDHYNFLAGEKTIFEDDFRNDQPGTLPSRWELQTGNAGVSIELETPAVSITEGNYGKLLPRIKPKHYLPEAFTIEFDHIMPSAGKPYGIVLFLVNGEGKEAILSFTDTFFTYTFQSKNFISQLPEDIRTKHYQDKWNHITVAFRHNQLTVYVNQFQILIIPDLNFAPVSMKIGGIGNKKAPIVFTNVVVSEIGGANTMQKLTTDGKLVVRSIRFYFNKAIIKTESMSALKEMAMLMKKNSAFQFEIQCHTDSEGEEGNNLTLSQDRADAVKNSLVLLGVRAIRLKAKGYGESKPILENNTPEGRANNRRIEFVIL